MKTIVLLFIEIMSTYKEVKKQFFLFLMCLPLLVVAQHQNLNAKGIKWNNELSFEELKNKAKVENKYIFLDVYASWCAPCKTMDKTVYVNDTLGNYFNDRFIAVKVQMDRTPSDDDTILKWHRDAAAIDSQFHIEGYPTLIFLSPQGQLVLRAIGLQSVSELISLAQTAVKPETVYDDPYVEYNEFVAEYKDGKRDFSRYPSMIKIAYSGNKSDKALGFRLYKELNQHISELPRTERYTREIIELWSGFKLLSEGPEYMFLRNDGKIIDRVIKSKGFAAEMMDQIIQNEICTPFMEQQAKGSGVAMKGMYITGGELKTVNGEANWKELYSILKRRFGRSKAKRAKLTARIEWYARHRNDLPFIKYSLLKFNKYSPDLKNGQIRLKINSVAWHAFLSSKHKKTLYQCKFWMDKILSHNNQFVEAIDTYANLLYKIGKKKEAIKWQEMAVNLAPENESMFLALEDMKLGRPTYVKYGAIW